MSRIIGVDAATACVALARWSSEATDLAHVGDSGNSVWRFVDRGSPWILRLTAPSLRDHASLEAELDFVRHLEHAGASVAAPLASASGRWVESVPWGDTVLAASVFHLAPGARVEPPSPAWGAPFMRAWGAALGAIHAASRSCPPSIVARRWRWHDEGWLADADTLLPKDDPAPRAAIVEAIERVRTFRESPENFGLIHADHGPQNFAFDPAGGVTTFDFGNCCRHFFVADVAIAFTVLRRLDPARAAVHGDAFLEGYRARSTVDESLLAELDAFVRLRRGYVYLSRLWAFGAHPDDDQRATLARLRALVLDPTRA